MTSPTSIRMENGSLNIPNHPIIPFIEGDGIGPDIWEASVNVLTAQLSMHTGILKKLTGLKCLQEKKPMSQKVNGYPNQHLILFQNT